MRSWCGLNRADIVELEVQMKGGVLF
jgi:hypothetical protein